MDCNKACEEIFCHLFTNYLYVQVPSFLIILEEDCLNQFGIIPKDNLSTEICEKLITSIKLKGPTGQTHEIRTKPYGDAIFLAKGWSDFISCYSLKSSDVLNFFYEGINIFRVKIFYRNRRTPPTVQADSKGTKGKGKQIAEDEAHSGIGLKRGRIERKNIMVHTDSKESRGSVKVRKQSPPEQMEISDRSGKNLVEVSNDGEKSNSRNTANTGNGPLGSHVRNQKDASVEFSLACSSTEMCQNNIVSSSSSEESWSSGSVQEIVTRSALQKDVVSISSGSFHDDSEVNGQCSQNLQAKEELDISENSDSDQVATTKPSKSRFVSSQKPITHRETRSTANQLAAQFTSPNPYFLKKIGKSNVGRMCRLNVLVNFGIENFPRTHSKITSRLPEGSRKWRVNCRYNRKRPQWYFAKGWSAFTHDNKIEIGDWCVFELTSTQRQKMKVHIFREDSYNDQK